MTAKLFPTPIAHRGLHDRAAGIIENSASAFRAAIKAGYAIECDLQFTSDGVPVVIHDPETTRLLGRAGHVAQMTAAEITKMPLVDSKAGDCPLPFSEFLKLVDGKALLQVELKRQRDLETTRAMAKAVTRALEGRSGMVTVESFEPEFLTAMRDAGFRGPLGIITYEYDDPDEHADLTDDERYIRRHLLHWRETRFDFVSCDRKALRLPAIWFWRSLGKPVTAWTIKSRERAETALLRADQIVFEGYRP